LNTLSHDPSDETEIPLRRTDAAFDADKARRAAKTKGRPGELCRAPAGRYEPVVDRTRCEGKKECVAVCPYDVFEVRTIDADEYRALPLLARLKLRVHGKQTAYTPRAADCRACGLCVVACPEHAITLARVDADSTLLSGQ
jgi:NAD-dependent dihydropyrimidine dehydrogenase PreA subunit